MEKGSNVFHFPSKSEGMLLETLHFALQYHFEEMPETVGYEKNNSVLFGRVKSASEHETEGAGYLCMLSLKNDPVAFVKDLARESEGTRQAVMNVMKRSVSTVKGAVVADILDSLPGDAVSTETGKRALNDLRSLFQGIRRLEPPQGPDPEELAARNARKKEESAQPVETQPTETEPESTQTEPKATEPKPTEPAPTKQSSQGITGWVVLPVFLIALAAVGLFAAKRKPH